MELNVAVFPLADFGVDTLVRHTEECKFPWLLSNVYDNLTGQILAEGHQLFIIEHQGKKVSHIQFHLFYVSATKF